MTRHIPLETIQNFRDFGGYGTASGRDVKRGLLYRSAQHASASDDDLAHMKTMNLAAIVDLRRPSEREKRPSRRWIDFDATLIEGDGEYESDVVWEEFIHASDHSAASFRWYLTKFYESAPLAPRHIDLFTRYFAMLAEAKGPILVHCAGGKDRTGMICALTHTLLGVHRDDIMSDFLATNDFVKRDLIGPAWAKDIAIECGREPAQENLAVAMSVEPGYLDTAFKVMSTHAGSVDGYIEKTLGVGAKTRAAIEARLLQ